MPSTTNFGWTTPADTDLVKDGASAIRTLGNGIDTSFVDLKGGTTGQVLAKATNADLDFTWTNGGDITNVIAGTGISGGGTSGDVTITNSMATAIDAKGDLIAGTGADTFSRLAIGSNDQVLTADSAAATGMKWAALPAAGGMTLLSTTTLSGADTTISSISQSYKDLKIVITDWATSSNGQVYVHIDSITSADSHRFVYTYGYPVSGGSSGNGIITSTQVNFNHSAYANATNTDSYCVIDITDYATTNSWKSITMTSYWIRESSSSRGAEWKFGTVESTSAIDSLLFAGTSNISGTVKVYGVN